MPSTRFVSTRDMNVQDTLDFISAIFQGLAPDGGVYYPVKDPDLSQLIQSFDTDIPFNRMAAHLTHALFPEEFSIEESISLCNTAFDFVPKLREVDDTITLLELFHGQSCAFKDFGAQYLASVMERQLEKTKQRITILTATSGDTGSAVAQAFYKKHHIQVVILYPSKRVSPLQEKQLTCLGKNIHALEVDGNFDDCQRMVKEAFLDIPLRAAYGLTSANSINIGRLIPQSFYYIYAWNLLKNQNDWIFCTPSGNFGNLTAGLLAWRWGMPVQHFIAATNNNRVVPEYLETGIYQPRESLATLANAMDVGDPSNFERMQTMFTLLDRPMNDVLYGAWATDDNITDEIRTTYERYNMFLCPHTAAGSFVARTVVSSFASHDSPQHVPYKKAIVLATAHPGKFFEIVESICHASPELPERLRKFLHAKKISHVTKATLDALREQLAYLLQ